jgi:hypothetical protein
VESIRKPYATCALIIMAISVFSMNAMAQDTSNSMNVLHLDGEGGYIEIPFAATYGLLEATVEGWVRWESFNKDSRVFDFGKKKRSISLGNHKSGNTAIFTIIQP